MGLRHPPHPLPRELMRINRFVATATGISRRQADTAIQDGRVLIEGRVAQLGDTVEPGQDVKLDGQDLKLPALTTIMLNKPPGYICSRVQQGGTPTVYELLPPSLHVLKPVGRLDKDSSGLLLLTNDGQLAHRLAHPRHHKWKIYEVTTQQPLQPPQLEALRKGVQLEDGLSQMDIDQHNNLYIVRLQEGRNRQIRRSFAAVNAAVATLHRTDFGQLKLGSLPSGQWREVEVDPEGAPA
ncbi:rRNA pseudouridine synthase [Patescibacteria group bacterium]|nr:MAG: rRNA pseudouridine synthase [Patescibacteria group bacterium]